MAHWQNSKQLLRKGIIIHISQICKMKCRGVTFIPGHRKAVAEMEAVV